MCACAGLPESLGGMTQLTRLVVHSNRLAALPPTICRLARCERGGTHMLCDEVQRHLGKQRRGW